MRECDSVERAVLRLYRVFLIHPMRVFTVCFMFCLITVVHLGIRFSDTGALVFILGLGPVLYFFSIRLFLWIWLRMQGIPAEYLRLE